MKRPRWSSTGRRMANTSRACWAPRTPVEARTRTAMASGSVSRMRQPRHVVARAGLEQAGAGRAGIAPGAAPRHARRPGRPMVSRLPSSPHRQGSSQSDPGESRLWIGRLAGRTVEEIARDPARLRDLHWSPRGEVLGLVRGGIEPRPVASATPASTPGQTATLHIWDRAGGLSAPLNNRPVRRFAGWCAAGDHLAYVVPDDILGAESPLWSFLLVPDPLARDAVLIEDGNGVGKGTTKPVFSGLRVTFPHWSSSSSDELLSVWCTFSPSHRSVLSRFLGGGLRSGDPAALLDARTGDARLDGRQPPGRNADRTLPPDQARVRRGVAAI